MPKTTWSSVVTSSVAAKPGRMVREPGVVPEPAEVRERAGGRVRREPGLPVRERGDPVCEEGCRSAEMPDLEPDAGAALERARVDEVRDRAGRVEGELVEPHGVAGQRQLVRREAGVEEDVGAATVELVEHGIPARGRRRTSRRRWRGASRRRARACRARARARRARRRRPAAAAVRAPRTGQAPRAPARRAPRSRRAPARAPGRRSPRKAPGGPVETTAPSIPKRSIVSKRASRGAGGNGKGRPSGSVRPATYASGRTCAWRSKRATVRGAMI